MGSHSNGEDHAWQEQGHKKSERKRKQMSRRPEKVFSQVELEGDKWKPLMARINELGLVEQVE